MPVDAHRHRQVLHYLGCGAVFYVLAAAHHLLTSPFAWTRAQGAVAALLGG